MMDDNVKTDRNSGLWKWQIVKIALLLSLLLFAQEYFFQGFNEESTRQNIRWSARIAVVLFSLAFVASAFHKLAKNSFSWWLRMNRKYIGISFAIVHLIHLCFLLILQNNFHPVFNMAKTISLLGGGLAYVFVVLMLFTSFPYFARYLSKKQWTVLHTAGGYWIWYIFIRSYVKRAMTEYEYLPLVILLAVVMLLRLWSAIKK